ncbi:MAG: hypothetical protein JWL77_3571 [Chthonomonadaceae bacterium]|nr:hypothetical protein [Chthonomonadaceae bacterium]
MLEIPLIAALLKEDVGETERLLQEGADPIAPAPDDSLPLLFAITVRNLQLIETLLAHGADPFAPDGRGYSAHQATLWIKDPAMLALFPEKPETVAPSE